MGTRAEGAGTGHTDAVDLDLLGFCPGGSGEPWRVGREVLFLSREQMEGWEEQSGGLWADGNYS